MKEFDVRIEIDAENDCFYLVFEGERLGRIVIPEGQSLGCEELLEIVNNYRRTLNVGYDLGRKSRD